MYFHRSRQRDSKAVESFGGSHRSMSELIGVSMAGLTAGVYLCNSACAGRGHAHKLERAFTEAPIASRRLSRQTKARAEGQKGRAAVRLTTLRLPGGAPADGAGRQSRSRPLAGGRPKLAARRPEGRQTWLEATDLKCRWPEDQAGSRHLGNKVPKVWRSSASICSV